MKSRLEKRGRPSRKDRPRHEAEVLERSIKVVNLKRNYDLTFKEIGDQLGISDAQAYRDFKSIMRKTLDEHREEIDEMRQMQNEQIAILWRKWLPKAVGDKQKEIDGDLRAAQFCERLLKRKAELNGLDAPKKLEHSGSLAVSLDELILSRRKERGLDVKTNGKAKQLEQAE